MMVLVSRSLDFGGMEHRVRLARLRLVSAAPSRGWYPSRASVRLAHRAQLSSSRRAHVRTGSPGARPRILLAGVVLPARSPHHPSLGDQPAAKDVVQPLMPVWIFVIVFGCPRALHAISFSPPERLVPRPVPQRSPMKSRPLGWPRRHLILHAGGQAWTHVATGEARHHQGLFLGQIVASFLFLATASSSAHASSSPTPRPRRAIAGGAILLYNRARLDPRSPGSRTSRSKIHCTCLSAP